MSQTQLNLYIISEANCLPPGTMDTSSYSLSTPDLHNLDGTTIIVIKDSPSLSNALNDMAL
ncbi:hypothetical protein CVT25_007815 [Psilocybe cyanescens]|uniref:Uncharacterized protein n=1 Tax=Psilocybe cyanescens TaxID=93625 RepID=A0A409W1C4_PSICY|nr:hypothetical protein CVT25_007815 [Psilocybe cyanescens]